ncbi:MAG: hypothetical protein RMM98_06275 [Acidobacteriota bacterium]|nr:hypothetical protein [Blastocatellia bacterium]MDW8239204.1 hypothetical protein [Acidobacteriota bacterium]
MALANFDLDDLREKVRAAYMADDPVLHKFRSYARRLREAVRPLKTYAVNAVSFVSADGGDNRLIFNPAIVELVRVVDSRGNQCALDVIPSTVSLAEMEQRAVDGNTNSVAPLSRLCRDLGKSLEEMSYLIRGLGQPGKSTGAIRCYRDIVEWAVLYDLVANPSIQWGSDTILVRDGLLRTKSFTREVFPLIDQKLRKGVDAHTKRNVTLSLVGVAKQSAVLSRLAVALELEETFHKPFPCYARVDEDIEADCYNFDRTWLDTYETTEADEDGRKLYQSMGKLFLVKFGDRPYDPVWPVDIAEWQVGNVEKILGQLTVDAQQGFPIPDYPMCIQRAHGFAKLTGLEVEVLQDILVQEMSQKLTDKETEKLLRMKHLGKSLAAIRYKEG